MIYDLVKIEARAKALVTVLNSEGLKLHGRRGDLTDQGLRSAWDTVVAKYRPQVDALAAEVEGAAEALDKAQEYETRHLLPPVPAAGLTAGQELMVARLLGRPNVLELENVASIIVPHLESPVATVVLQEAKARNESITDEFVASILSNESSLYSSAVEGAAQGRQIIGILRQLVVAIRHALQVENVNGHDLNSHGRPGSYIPSLESVYGEGVHFTISDQGNVHV